jgi:hypothetical protein
MLRIAVFVALVLAGMAARAQEVRDYLCTVERVSNADDAESRFLEMQRKTLAGKQFSVSRRTGVMTGALKNSFITQPEVIDVGSADNSFKAVTTLRPGQGRGPGSNINVLVVREFEPGQNKPFIFLDNEDLYFGKCRHF